MKFAEYVPLAIRTCKPLPFKDHINHMGLGIVGEMGELADQIKKAYIYGKGVDQVNIIEEVGDVAWHVAGIAHHYPTLIEWVESEELKASVNHERLAEARQKITRAILLNSMSAANLCVDLGGIVDSEIPNDDPGAVNVVKTIGTMLFATALLLEVDLAQAYEVNIAKLAKRYGDKYSDYSALNRDVQAERSLLESATSMTDVEVKDAQ